MSERKQKCIVSIFFAKPTTVTLATLPRTDSLANFSEIMWPHRFWWQTVERANRQVERLAESVHSLEMLYINVCIPTEVSSENMFVVYGKDLVGSDERIKEKARKQILKKNRIYVDSVPLPQKDASKCSKTWDSNARPSGVLLHAKVKVNAK